MPSIYVHDKLSRDISSNTKININNNSYIRIFGQSFDHLFSYNVMNFKTGKKYRKLGHYAHTHKVWEYFYNIITYIKNNNLYENEECLSYLYGSLCHYSLDSIAHPYVHYISGRFSRKNRKETKKYIGNHAKNEIMLDALYYYKEHNETYYTYKIFNELFPKVNFSDELKKLIDYAYEKTFNEREMGSIYYKAYLYNKKVYRLLMFDRLGFKTLIYKIVDVLTPLKKFKAKNYSHHVKKLDYSVLNEKHDTWLHPINGEKSNKSFQDLYDEAYKLTLKRIDIVNKYFKGTNTIEEVKKVIGNISYSSGLDCDIRANFQYFKY